MNRKWIATIALAALVAGCSKGEEASGNMAEAGKPIAAPAGTEWASTVTKTPDGGFVMGNPAAPVKLVEYGSLTCGHCAEFSEGASGKLVEKYVASGRVSFEFRNYVRDQMDLIGALATRCGGPGPYFAMTEQLFAEQAAWFKRMQSAPQAEQEALGKLGMVDQFKGFAKLGGIDVFAAQRGVPEAKLNACLSDKASLDELDKMREYANNEVQLTGTPTFLINGSKLENVGTWADLEPKLRAAGG